MVMKEKYEAPELFVESFMCDRGFDVSGMDGVDTGFDNGEDGDIIDLY